MPTGIEVPKHHKKIGKKPFKIEYRCTGSSFYREWRTNSRYETAKQRDQALHNLQSKRHHDIQIYEYRIPPEGP